MGWKVWVQLGLAIYRWFKTARNEQASQNDKVKAGIKAIDIADAAFPKAKIKGTLDSLASKDVGTLVDLIDSIASIGKKKKDKGEI